jgi:hypothetical protein
MSSAMILLGWAVQNGHIPLHINAIEAALRLNAVDVANKILRRCDGDGCWLLMKNWFYALTQPDTDSHA